MKQTNNLFLIGLFLILSISLISANSYTGSLGEGYQGSIDVKKGWNLIPTLSMNYRFNQENPEVIATYNYDNERKYYIKGYPEPDFAKSLILTLRYEKLIESFVNRLGRVDIFNIDYQDRDIGRIGSFFNSASWIYIENDKKISFGKPTDAGFLQIEKVRLTKGWNFITITPDVVENYFDKSIGDIKGDCIIEKAYIYEGDKGGWMNIKQKKFDRLWVWKGMVVKDSNEECYLGEAPSGGPPQIPDSEGLTIPPASLDDVHIDENAKCIDTDPENDINIKGKVYEIESRGSFGDACVYEIDDPDKGHYAIVDGIYYSMKYSCNSETEGVCRVLDIFCEGDKRGYLLKNCPGSCTGGACV